ncbi:hypothetical protein [Roseovarius sp.]
MKSRHFIPITLAGASALAVYPLFAQERDESALNASLSVSQRFEAGDNIALDIPSSGSTQLATTSLRFNLNSETRTQSLSLSLGGVFREGNVPSRSEISTGFADPDIRLSYSREGANALFSVDGRFSQSDVGFVRSIEDFIDQDGEIVLPDDFDELDGRGKRNNYNLSTQLQTGRNAPIGFVFDAGVSGLYYTDNARAGLSDTERSRAGVTALLRFSPVTTGRVALNYDRYESDDTLQTKRDTYSVNFGVENQLFDGTVVDASLGYTEIDTRETIGSTTRSGVIGQIGLQRPMTNGEITASLATTVDQAGDRVTLRFGRNLQLPNGSLSASLGATSFEGRSPDLVGSLNWQYQLARSALSVRLNRTVSTNDEDEERLATSAVVNYSYDINTLSSLGLSMDYGLTDGTGTTNETERAGISLSYNRSLTRDWTLSTGVSHRIRDEERLGNADSTSVFVSLSRSFDLLP